MGRSWGDMGLTEAATAFLEGKVRVGLRIITQLDLNNTVEGTWTETVWRRDPHKKPYSTAEVYEERSPFNGIEQTLNRYTFPDGRVVEEYVQEEPWESGPNTYLALRDTSTGQPIEETLWPHKTMFG